MLDYKPSTKEKVLSTGDFWQNEDGTETEEALNMPDWYQGARMRVNDGWFRMISQKMYKDIKGVSQQGISPRELSTHNY